MDVQKALEEINVLIKNVTDPVAKVIISRLLNIIEALVQENKILKEENQRLRDENNRLKGEQGKPNIRPQSRANISSEKERKPRDKNNKHTRSNSKNHKVKINKTIRCKINPEKLPENAAQIKAVKKALDSIEYSRNSTSEYQVTPAVLPLAPIAVNILNAAFGAYTAFLIWKATNETKQTLQQHEEEQTHRTEFPIDGNQRPYRTEFPIEEHRGTRTEFPIEPAAMPNALPGPSADPIPVPEVSGFPIHQPENFLLFSKRHHEKPTNVPRVDRRNPDHEYVDVPKQFKDETKIGVLPAFPDSRYVGKQNNRDTWVLDDKKFLQWDRRHGEVELFNKTGKEHLGAYDPYTGNKLKEGKPDRTAKPK